MDLVLTVYLVIGLILSFPAIFTKDESEHPVRNMLFVIFLWPVALAVLAAKILSEDDD
jgi:hypothetical protein